jgi:hypothetical protein
MTLKKYEGRGYKAPGLTIVSSVIWNEKSKVGIVEHGSNSDQTSATTWHNADVLPSVLTRLSLSVVHVVQVRDRLSQGSDTSSWAVLSTGAGDVNGLGTLERALDIIVDFGSTLTEVGPGGWILEETMLHGSFGTPDNTSRGTSGIETGMGAVTLMGIAELTMDLGLRLYTKSSAIASSPQLEVNSESKSAPSPQHD